MSVKYFFGVFSCLYINIQTNQNKLDLSKLNLELFRQVRQRLR